mgnify:CR=1 FL=1
MTERNRTDKLEAPSNAIGKILSFIRERRYQPSERLPSERDFAEKFDTSRGAVREALAALEPDLHVLPGIFINWLNQFGWTVCRVMRGVKQHLV